MAISLLTVTKRTSVTVTLLKEIRKTSVMAISLLTATKKTSVTVTLLKEIKKT